MIEFSCQQCGNELSVPDSKIGARGKCPRCSSVLVVPSVSTPSNQLIFAEDDNFFSNRVLNKLYKKFLKSHDGLVRNHKVAVEEWGNSANFEIITKANRSQIVNLLNFKDADDVDWVSVFSFAGTITTNDSAVYALRKVPSFAQYNIRLTDSNQLVLSSFMKTEELDADSFNSAILLVAVRADELEEELFGIDVL